MLDLRFIFSTAFEALVRNKTRTALAILGIVIGIGAVIALISLGQGSKKSVENRVEALGSNLLTVSPGFTVGSGGVRGAAGGSTTLTNDDAEAIATSTDITTVSKVSPEYSSRSQVTAGRNNTNTSVYGVTATYADVHAVSLASGVFISENDQNNSSRVAVLGPTTVSDLFGDIESAVGQTVRINKIAFTVVGVTASKGGTGFSNQDDLIFVPLSVAQKPLFGSKSLSTISVQLKEDVNVNQAKDEIGYLLLDQHNLTDPTAADFSMRSQEDTLAAASEITNTLTALLSGIAAISLLVGGIGIMNIMLVTVIERTREIGLRKALGARRVTIVVQFLTEAIILTFSGGILGIILGVLLSFLASKFLNYTVAMTWSSMGLAVGVSGAIGILFGWYPAQKASRLTPIEALRYE